jgi:hypothetical protein
MVKTAKKKKKKASPKLEQKMRPWEKPVPFVENFKWPGGRAEITFEADSFTEWVEAALPQTKEMKPCSIVKAKEEGIPVGENIFYLRSFPMVTMQAPYFFCTPRPGRNQLQIYRGTTAAWVGFSDVVNIPILAHNRFNS